MVQVHQDRPEVNEIERAAVRHGVGAHVVALRGDIRFTEVGQEVGLQVGRGDMSVEARPVHGSSVTRVLANNNE